jgi:hypothetical protein
VFELDKTNNIGAGAGPILIESRPADLVVTGLAAPSSAQAGGSLLASWTVRNQGSGDTAVSRWADRLVLSADATLGNADDVTLLTSDHNGLLAAGEGYTVSNQVVTIPFSVTPGTWRLFAVADSGNAVYEAANDANNASAPRTIAITRTTADLRVASVSIDPIGMGGAGNLPAPLGDPPGGTGKTSGADQGASSKSNALAVPSGESPDGTGGSPVLPSNHFPNTLS